MALNVVIEGTGSIAVANINTETWLCPVGGVSPVDETDIFLQGNEAVSFKFNNKDGPCFFDIGAGNELDWTGTQAGELVYMWIQITTIGALDTKENNGVALLLGTSQTDYDYWTFFGSNTKDKYQGGWICLVIDPTLEPTGDAGSGLNLASVRYFGLLINTVGGSRAENVIIDQITVGTGIRITGSGATDGWQDVSNYCNDFSNRAFGQFQEKEGIYFIYGHLYVGSTGQGEVTELIDSGRIFKYGGLEYWTVGSAWAQTIPDGLMGLSSEDHTDYTTKFQDGILVGTDEGRSGSTFIGSEISNVVMDLYAGNNANSETLLYGTQFKKIYGGITWGNDSDHKGYSVVIDQCGLFDPVGAVNLRNLVISNAYGTGDYAALKWNANIDIRDSSFIANADAGAHAIEYDTAGEYNIYGLDFSGNLYDIMFSAGSDDLTINNLEESTANTYEITGGGSNVYINTLRSLTLSGLVSNSEVRILDTNKNELDGIESSSTSFEYAYNYSPGTNIYIVVFHIQYKAIWQQYLLTDSNQTIPISQEYDRNYSNP